MRQVVIEFPNSKGGGGQCRLRSKLLWTQIYFHTCTVTLHPGTPLLTVADTHTEPDNVNFGLGRPAFTVVSLLALTKWPF
jgi:hypothetical protein